ncbi:uncharacterized protein LOC117315128 [Pecten maximus]|uniref:uncharacterized protein LOC117315128 n=1 Tax=Pecten maximus TaxID=6579 RepID=UPI001458C67D|nr:uncharacterized protein LOC117315128 [Pecten maximus]
MTFQHYDEESDFEQYSENEDQDYLPSSFEESHSESDSEMEMESAVYQQKRSRSFSESENEEVKPRKRVMTIKEDTDYEMVSNSDSDISEIIPIQIPSSGPISLQNISSDEENDDSDFDEEEINRDVKNKSIFVRRIMHSTTTKKGKAKRSDRVYNSKCSCPFCRKMCSSFAQHIFSKKHCNEPEVKKVLALKGKQRKTMLAVLRSKGSNIHNENVIKQKKGEILLARRSGKEQFDVTKYGPCPNCFGWLRLSVLDRHQAHCPVNNSSVHVSKGSLLMQSAVLAGRVTEEASQALVKEVFSIMLDDKVGKIAKTDSLIIALGNQWLTRNIGNKLMRKHYVSAVMRLASRLLIQLRILATPNTGIHLENYLHPMFFTHVAQAALKVARQDNDDEENLEAPSNAIKLSYDLKRLGNIKLAKAIKNGDEANRKAAKDFLKLMEIEWTAKLSRVLLHERKSNKGINLPLPNDVQKLASYLKRELESFNTSDASYDNYRKGVVLVESNLITYNRRRPGEVQAMRLTAYEKRKTGLDQSDELTGVDLTKFEKRLVEDQDVIEIRGKCGKFVPVIVPKHARRILKFLTSDNVRRSAGVSERNPYVFASNREGIIRGYDAVRSVTEAAGLEHPERIRGTNMRRLMATLSQILFFHAIDVTPQQQQWIVDHLGHTLDVHKIHYKCTSDMIERVDIAKLLLMMDNRLLGKFKGKRLEEFQLDELLENNTTDPELEPGQASGDLEEPIEDPENQDSGNDENFIPHLPVEEEESLRKEPTRRKAPTFNRHKWSLTELDELRDIFKASFRNDNTSGQKAIEEGKKTSKRKGGQIWQLDTSKIKKKISLLRLHPTD